MDFARLHDRDQIEAYLRLHADTHVYGLGDLEDEFWPHTSWYGALDGSDIRAICLVFTLYDPPIVIAVSEPDNAVMPHLLGSIAGQLPDSTMVHLGPEAVGILDGAFDVSTLVPHWKMALKDRSSLESVDTSHVSQLNHDDVPRLEALFDAVYSGSEAGNIFYPSMLDIGPYFGVEESGRIVSTAGVHVYSTRYGVAAIANVATHPGARGRGLATAGRGKAGQRVGSPLRSRRAERGSGQRAGDTCLSKCRVRDRRRVPRRGHHATAVSAVG